MNPEFLEAFTIDSPAALDDSRVSAVVDRLHHVSSEWRDLQCWLLIDPALRDPLADFSCLDADVAASARKIDIPWMKFPARLKPYILPIDISRSGPSSILERSVRMSFEDIQPITLARRQGRRICGCLWTTACGEELSRHLGRRAIVRDRSEIRYFRYFDPFVLDLLWASSDESSQRNALLGPVEHWNYVDRFGENGSMTSERVNPDLPDISSLDWNFMISENRSMTLADVLNEAISLWSADNLKPLRKEKFTKLLDILSRAISQGLVARGDQVDFVRTALTVGIQFAKHPLMIPVWEAVSKGEDWFSAMARLTHDDWAVVAGSDY